MNKIIPIEAWAEIRKEADLVLKKYKIGEITKDEIDAMIDKIKEDVFKKYN